MKGILLAGGSGTRLYPLSLCISKQLLPVYNKPVIYYSLSTLMLAGIREILIICNFFDLVFIKKTLGDGTHLGLSITYAIQDKPDGIAHAFIIGEEFIGDSSVCLILGDNMFFCQDWHLKLQSFKRLDLGASLLAYHVANPSNFGVIEFDENNKVISIEEKPLIPKSSYVVPGLYFYDNQVVGIAKDLIPSARGELEITDVNNVYLHKGHLNAHCLGRGVAWFDLGSFDNLKAASVFVESIETRQNFKIACLEEIALRMNFIDKNDYCKNIQKMPKSPYRSYLEEIITTF